MLQNSFLINYNIQINWDRISLTNKLFYVHDRIKLITDLYFITDPLDKSVVKDSSDLDSSWLHAAIDEVRC